MEPFRASGQVSQVNRTFSLSFWAVLVITAVIAITARLYFLGSYRIVTDDFSPQLLRGDWVLVPKWEAIMKWSVEIRPLEAGDFVVFHTEDDRKRVGRVEGVLAEGAAVRADGKVRIIPASGVEGRLWRIWFSVGQDGPSREIRWERVLRGIN